MELDDFEKLESLLEDLREDSRLKLVEGAKDRQALESLGVSNIRVIRGPLANAVEKLGEEAILLPDYDRRGKLLLKRLVELCENEAVRVDLNYWKKLRQTARLAKIEELRSKYEELRREYEGDIRGKNLHRHGKIRCLRECRDRRHY